MENIVKEKIAYKGNHRGYTFTATYLIEPKYEALIEIEKDGNLIKEFLFPAYKIFNIAAHIDDIIELLVAMDGLGGNSYQG